jgi:hypothetical protein
MAAELLTHEDAARCTPGQVCKALLAALEAAEGRRKMRKRDQTPDAIGLAAKRELLQQAVRENPAPDAFEEWLLNYTRQHERSPLCGTVLAMARAVLEEWRLVHAMPEFAAWLERDAPSDDRSAAVRRS